MKKIQHAILAVFLLMVSADMQAQQYPWGAFFGSAGADFATDIHQTEDGGYIIAAYGSTGNSANYYVVKLDASGLLQWETNLSKDNYASRAYSVLAMPDGGYVVVGRAGMLRKPWLVKLDDAGETVWTSEWTDNLPANSALAAKGTLLPDNRIVVVGASGELGQQPKMFIVSPEGALLEDRLLNAPVPPGWYAGTFVSHIERTSDGGFVMTGTAGSGSGSKAFLWKFDQQADSSWVKLYSNENMRGAESVKQLADGGYIMAGFSSPNSEHACAMRTDENGNVIWFEVYPDSIDNPATDVIPWHNGEFIITEKRFYGVGSTFFQAAMLRIDSEGNLLGRDMIMASDSSTAITRMRNTSDGGFVMAGEINEYMVVNEQDLFVLKSDSTGIITGLSIDYVWPGDVNLDGVVDMNDLMILGLTAGASGSARVNASIAWFPQYVTNWADTVVIGVNYKHADTDGNGIVDISDTIAIVQNYGLTHGAAGRGYAWPQFVLSDARSGAPQLFVRQNEVILLDGKHLRIPLHLGTAEIPVEGIYGLVFSLMADPEMVDTETVKLNHAPSWLGSLYDDLWAMQRTHPHAGFTDFGITRNDHNSLNGFGAIGTLEFSLLQEIPSGSAITLELSFGNLCAYGYNLNELDIGSGIFELLVENSIVGLSESISTSVVTQPNPVRAGQSFSIHTNAPSAAYSIFDMQGRLVYSESGQLQQKATLLAPERQGVYVLVVEDKTGKKGISRLVVK